MNQKLRDARLRKGWSQQEAADAVNVTLRTYQRWEHEQYVPNFASRRFLRDAFGTTDKELGFDLVAEYDQQAVTNSDEQIIRLTAEQVAVLKLVLGESSMAHDPTKRKTLEKLAAVLGMVVTGTQLLGEPEILERFPLQTNGLSKGVDEALGGHFEAQTKLCWNLLKVDGLPIVQQLLPTYLPALEALAQQSSQFQNKFAGLAAQGYMLAGLIAVLQLNNPVAEACCKQAVQYSRLAGDHNLEVAALKHLATKYNDAKYPVKTLQTYQEALPLVNHASPLLHSRTYLGLALASAQCGHKQEAFRYFGLAQETFPERAEDDPSFAFADCGPSSLNHYGGLIYLEFDQPEKAWKMFAGVEALRSKIVIPERTFIEIVNCQTEAAVAQRDLEKACTHIQVGIAGALKLKSEMRFNEVFSIYRQMKIIWPHESRVKALVDLFQR